MTNITRDPLRFSPGVDQRLRAGDWTDLQIVSAAFRVGLPWDDLESITVKAMNCERLLRRLPAANWRRPETIASLEPREQWAGPSAWDRLTDAERKRSLSRMTVSQYMQALPRSAVGYLGLLASSANAAT